MSKPLLIPCSGRLTSRRPGGFLALGLALSLALSGCQVPFGTSASGDTAGSRAAGSEARATTGVRSYDVEHYAIDIVLYPATRTIESVCRIRFQPTGAALSEMELDLVGLEVRGVADSDGQALEFQHDGQLLRVNLGASLDSGTTREIAVTYGGTPTTGLWFSGKGVDDMPTQVFTQGQAEENRGWFPCFDHPSDRATSEVRVTMPKSWISMAPGARIELVETESARTEHWRMDTSHPSYLVSLVAGEFVMTESEWEGIPLQFLVEPRYAKWAEAAFHETDEILTFLSEYTGVRYPYPKYAQSCVDNFPWGGMENISATTLTPLTLGDERSIRDSASTSLVAHEAAHQWFGDLFTCNDWSHIWLNEGFATYMTLLYFEQSRGVDDFRIRLRDAQEAYLREDTGSARRSTVSSDWRDPEDVMDTRAYQGAAARLHLLRFVLGDDVFRAGVQTYAAENSERNVVTDDLKDAMEKVSGRDLDGFFDQWFYARGYPEFEVDWEWDRSEGTVTLDVRQVQNALDGTPSVFKLPVDIEIRDLTGPVVHRIELTRRHETFEFAVEGQPFYVQFDKNGWIPKRMRSIQDVSELLAIASQDDDVNGRRDAIRALGLHAVQARKIGRVISRETVVAELTNRLRRDSNPHVRVAAAMALGAAGGVEARERLVEAARSNDEAPVRVAILNALAKMEPSKDLADLGREAFDERYSWATMGAAAGLVANADPSGAYAWLTQKLFIDSPHDALRAELLTHLGQLDSAGVDSQLMRWAVDETSHPTARAAAITQLGQRRLFLSRNSRFVSDFLDAPNFRLRRAAVDALSNLSDAHARQTLRAYYPKARTSGERRTIEAALVGRP